MGVLGLTTWAERSLRSSSHRLEPGSVLVIDGLNWLAVCVTVQVPAEAMQEIDAFLSMLEAGGVTPLFVFDGAAPIDKMPTVRQRAAQRNEHVKRMLSVLPCGWTRWTTELRTVSLSAAPYATVVMDTLQSHNARCFFCVEDADVLIGSVATAFSAPILSNDSDFLLWPCAAVIRADSLSLVDGIVYGTARSAEQLRFALRLPSVEWLPLFGALLGNDYVERSQRAASGTSLARRVESVAAMLRTASSPDAALDQLGLSAPKRAALMRSLAASRPLPLPQPSSGVGGVESMLTALRHWDAPPASLAKVAPPNRPFFIACLRGTMLLGDFAEDLREETCWMPSAPIRALAYAAALLPVDTNESLPRRVTEYWRQPHGSAVVSVDAEAWHLPRSRAALVAESVDARWRRVMAALGGGNEGVLPPPPKSLLSAVRAMMMQASELYVSHDEAAALASAFDDSEPVPTWNPMVRRRGVHLFACIRATLASLEMLLRALHLPLDPLVETLKFLEPKRLFVALDLIERRRS